MIRTAYLVPAASCVGLAGSLVVRASLVPAVALACCALVAPRSAQAGSGAGEAAGAQLRNRAACGGAGLALLLVAAGWWWGSERLRALDRTVLAAHIGTAERALVETQEPAHVTRFAVRVQVVVRRWGALRLHERALLELPLGRSPPQGARLRVLGVLREPDDFERTRLRRHGVHVVLRASAIAVVGARNSVADRLHAWLARASVPGLAGERRAVLEGVVLGEDQGLSDGLKQRFRASGLYHLLAVSGGNVLVVGGGAVVLALALGLSRLVAESLALLAIAGYVLAVGPQPSVLRAGIAGGLGCLAWLSGRERDRWHAYLLGAAALLAWNPWTLLDPGFQLSFAAVAAIFVAAPRVRAWLEGYPLPPVARDAIALSAVCGTATAPISWLHFHQIPIVTIPANLAAAPVVAPLLALALLAAVLPPVGPLLAQANGWLAAYLAGCARFFGGLPGAQVKSGAGAAVLAAGALLLAAYACRRGERAEAGLSAARQRPAEDRARGAPAA